MSWVSGAAGSGYGVEHLPFGATDNGLWVRIGDFAFDLGAAEERGLVHADGTLWEPTLNRFLAAGPGTWRTVRARLTDLLTDPAQRDPVESLLVPVGALSMRLPFDVADYVDFYSCEQHATNLGQIFRPDQPPLLPNWRHLPVGYHGRAGTVVVSGTEVTRPCGQRRPPDADAPVFGPSVRLDIEAEVGFVVGTPTELGTQVSTADFGQYVFGVVLVNDWSARDIQAWEYQPLGPFLGKSFATSIAAWVTPLDALAAARVPAPEQDPPVFEYLLEADRAGYDLRLEVEWNGTVVSRPPFAGTYWTPAQQLAHMTVNGARLRTGDLYASGTVSGSGPAEAGSFLELSWGGRDEITLGGGASRTFLLDGDTVTIRATAPGPDGGEISLAEVTGTVGTALHSGRSGSR